MTFSKLASAALPTQKKPEITIGIALANRGENIFRAG